MPKTAPRFGSGQTIAEIGFEFEADLFLREIQVGRQSRLLLGSGNESEHPGRIALRQKFVAYRW